MDPHINHLKKAHRVKLSASAKASIRQTLLSHIENNPVREASSARLLYQNPFSFFTHFLTFRSSLLMPILILTIVAMLGGGTAFAAQSALPGDFLYPVKVNINEEIQNALTFKQEAKANLELSHAEERVKEALSVEAKGELQETKKEQIEDQIARHSARISDIAKKLEDRGNEQAAQAVRGNLEVYLETKAAVLSKIGMPILNGDSDKDKGIVSDSEKNEGEKPQPPSSPRREEIHNLIKSIKTENAELLLKLKMEEQEQEDDLDRENEAKDEDNDRIEVENEIETEIEVEDEDNDEDDDRREEDRDRVKLNTEGKLNVIIK